MTKSPDITVVMNLHREGLLALPALSSMCDMVITARHAGLHVEARAVLDSSDQMTRHFVATRGEWLDDVQEVSMGDLGLARNAAAHSARGQFLAFLDGDDLWGKEWLRLAHQAATCSCAATEAIWHPEMLYYFSGSDFDHHSVTSTPHPEARSFVMRHLPSDHKSFDRDVLFMDNIWTANVFTLRRIHLRFPYSCVSPTRGFGIEDWSWNIDTLWGNLTHKVVGDTVHLIRIKETGSLREQNSARGLLPYLPKSAWPHLGGHETRLRT
jgi:hypothetical protein